MDTESTSEHQKEISAIRLHGSRRSNETLARMNAAGNPMTAASAKQPTRPRKKKPSVLMNAAAKPRSAKTRSIRSCEAEACPQNVLLLLLSEGIDSVSFTECARNRRTTPSSETAERGAVAA